MSTFLTGVTLWVCPKWFYNSPSITRYIFDLKRSKVQINDLKITKVLKSFLAVTVVNDPIYFNEKTKMWQKLQTYCELSFVFLWFYTASTIARYKQWKCVKVITVHVHKDLSFTKSRQDLFESVLKAWSKLHRTHTGIHQLYESIQWCMCSDIAQKAH